MIRRHRPCVVPKSHRLSNAGLRKRLRKNSAHDIRPLVLLASHSHSCPLGRTLPRFSASDLSALFLAARYVPGYSPQIRFHNAIANVEACSSLRRCGDVTSVNGASMQGRVWQADKASALLDEAPSAYKDIEAVMERQADLCRPIRRLEALVNYKGT